MRRAAWGLAFAAALILTTAAECQKPCPVDQEDANREQLNNECTPAGDI